MKDVSPFKEVLLACDSKIRKLKKDSGTPEAGLQTPSLTS